MENVWLLISLVLEHEINQSDRHCSHSHGMRASNILFLSLSPLSLRDLFCALLPLGTRCALLFSRLACTLGCSAPIHCIFTTHHLEHCCSLLLLHICHLCTYTPVPVFVYCHVFTSPVCFYCHSITLLPYLCHWALPFPPVP